jgi:hypothetical protein
LSDRSFSGDESGVTAMMEFILMFILAAAIFSIFVMNFNSIFMNQPKYVVASNQFVDIGNDVTTKIIDTYLIAPDNGTVLTFFDMPESIAGYTYAVNVKPVGVDDREVEVFTDQNPDLSVFTTLNGANTTISINGMTSSTSSQHGIVYNSNLIRGP